MGKKRKDHGAGLFTEMSISEWANAGFPGMDNGIDGTNHPEIVAKNIRNWARTGEVPKKQYKYCRMCITKYSEWMNRKGFDYSDPPKALSKKLRS
jgi:hypothetical protein